MRRDGADCMKTNKCIIVYSVLILFLNLGTDLLVVSQFGYTSQKANLIFLLCMWIPTLVLLATKLICKDKIYFGLKCDIHISTANKDIKKYILIAVLIPIVAVIIGNVIMMSAYPDSFSTKDVDIKLLVAIILQAISVSTVYSFALSIGEELGFRGYLMPLLDKKYGKAISIIAGGIIYGACSGVKLYNGYLFGNDYKGSPYIGILIYVIFAISLSGVLYWLYEKSGNILVPALYQGFVSITTLGLANIFAIKEISALMTGIVYMGLVTVLPGITLIIRYFLSLHPIDFSKTP